MCVTKQELFKGRVDGAITSLSLYAFMSWTGTNLLYLYRTVTTVTIDCYEKLIDSKEKPTF